LLIYLTSSQSTPNVLILESAHPSPLSAHRGFLGNGHFKKANNWLEADSRYGKSGGIKWGDMSSANILER
jgi:uracil-DNA glycosylase